MAANSWGAGAGWAVPNYIPDSASTQDMTSSDATGSYSDYIFKPQDARYDIGNEYGNPTAGGAVTPGLLNVPSNQSMSNSAISSMGTMSGMGDSTLGAVGGGIGAIAGAYNNASDDTGSSVLSGAASGAAAGTAILPGWGTAIGAVIGGIAGFFGSKSKKDKEKKAFQQQEQLAVLPEQQKQANWLQQQGLEQKAISNYKSGYTPGGYQYSNSLLGNPGGAASNFKTPGAASLPNFNVAPPNATPGKGDPSLGIAPNSVANNGVNTSSGLVPANYIAPTTTIKQPAPVTVTPPVYSKNAATNQTNLNAYATNYQALLNQQNQESAAASMDPYKAFYGASS